MCLHESMKKNTQRTRRDAGLLLAMSRAPVKEIAANCGVTRQAVSLWRRIPAEHVLTVEALTGLDREVLRPDLYGAPRPRPRVQAAA